MRDDLAANLALGLGQYAKRHSVALVIQGSAELHVGSASCVEIGGRFFLATVAHNLTGIDKLTVRILVMKDSESTGFEFSRWNRSKQEDLAWIEVDQALARREGVEAVSVDRLALGAGLHSDHLYMVLGVQAESATDLIKKSSIVGFARHIGYVLRVQALLTQSVADQSESVQDFRLHYERQVVTHEGLTIDQRHPGGMSGGGLWSATEQEGLWDPSKSRLLGVIRAYDNANDQLFVIPIIMWLRLLIADNPELAQYVPLPTHG